MNDKGNIIIYQTKDGQTLIDVRLENETVWINRQQMAELFDRDVKTIGKHITNALKEELKEIPVVAKFATVQQEGERSVTRQVEYYNLEMMETNVLLLFSSYARTINADLSLTFFRLLSSNDNNAMSCT